MLKVPGYADPVRAVAASLAIRLLTPDDCDPDHQVEFGVLHSFEYKFADGSGGVGA